MPTGSVNGESISKTMRVPLNLSGLVEQIARRENRSYSNTVITILKTYIMDYNERSIVAAGDKTIEKNV